MDLYDAGNDFELLYLTLGKRNPAAGKTRRPKGAGPEKTKEKQTKHDRTTFEMMARHS